MTKKIILPALLAAFIICAAAGGAPYFGKHAARQENGGTASVNEQNGQAAHSGNTGGQSPEQKTADPAKGGEAAAVAQPSSQNAGPPRNATRTGGGEENAGARQQTAPGGTDPLRSQIEEKYIARLQSLASGYEARLNGLMAAAAGEYQAAKRADPKADITPIINKYYSAGKALEAECDSQFYPLLAEFESALSAHSFPLDTAVQARAAYEARKSGKAGQILSGSP